ncbi:unnamed protein product [Caenorhabditis auriculariae]|uniref:G-protein coupled receptors family 1 profile domain-containing protein n=1 Tax=Caenorhabditis auriculariae TaxID=2777116 RepID=A0A8S1HU51_9PELO|nr:unnamed protein product [Caenorhabditis auriculariae]
MAQRIASLDNQTSGLGVGETPAMANLVSSYGTTLFMCILYTTLGSLSIITNIIHLSVYASTCEFRRKYLFFIALEIGELINAISYVLTGMGRGTELLEGSMQDPITVHQCFYTKYWPHALILGTELPAVCMIIISTERIFAVLKPGAYKRVFTGHRKFLLLMLVPLFGTVSVSIGGLSALGSERDRLIPTRHCAIINSTAKWYSTFHFLFGVTAYTMSFASTTMVWSMRKKYSSSRFGSEDKLSVVMAISASSILLVALPAIVMICIRWDVASFNDVQVALTYACPGFLSIANTIISFKFRKELRHQLLLLLGLKKQAAIIKVFSASMKTTQITRHS